jgi:ABC-type dipeptide/oligopeptide/nickel transport system permease subunit
MNLLADAAVMALDPRARAAADRCGCASIPSPFASRPRSWVFPWSRFTSCSPLFALDRAVRSHGAGRRPRGGARDEFLMGTDVLGRDYLSRLLHGGRMALLVTFTG